MVNRKVLAEASSLKSKKVLQLLPPLGIKREWIKGIITGSLFISINTWGLSSFGRIQTEPFHRLHRKHSGPVV